MARRKHKGWRQRGKKVTVAVMIGRNERKFRANTMKQALTIAERAMVPRGCRVRWFHSGKSGAVVRRLPGRSAGLDGAIVCPAGGAKGWLERDRIYAMVYRPKARQAWYKRQRIQREAYRKRGY